MPAPPDSYRPVLAAELQRCVTGGGGPGNTSPYNAGLLLMSSTTDNYNDRYTLFVNKGRLVTYQGTEPAFLVSDLSSTISFGTTIEYTLDVVNSKPRLVYSLSPLPDTSSPNLLKISSGVDRIEVDIVDAYEAVSEDLLPSNWLSSTNASLTRTLVGVAKLYSFYKNNELLFSLRRRNTCVNTVIDVNSFNWPYIYNFEYLSPSIISSVRCLALSQLSSILMRNISVFVRRPGTSVRTYLEGSNNNGCNIVVESTFAVPAIGYTYFSSSIGLNLFIPGGSGTCLPGNTFRGCQAFCSSVAYNFPTNTATGAISQQPLVSITGATITTCSDRNNFDASRRANFSEIRPAQDPFGPIRYENIAVTSGVGSLTIGAD